MHQQQNVSQHQQNNYQTITKTQTNILQNPQRVGQVVQQPNMISQHQQMGKGSAMPHQFQVQSPQQIKVSNSPSAMSPMNAKLQFHLLKLLQRWLRMKVRICSRLFMLYQNK